MTERVSEAPNAAAEPGASAPAGRPLSLGQQALWLLHRLAPDSAAYNDADAITIAPVPDVGVLQRAVVAVLLRHDLLRSRFIETAHHPARMVCVPDPAPVDVRDVPGVDDDQLLALARQAGGAPFRLADTGPFRVVLLRRTGDAALVVAAHHIASDALSQRIIWRDLSTAYQALAIGSEPGWPTLTATFDDYVARERALLDSPRRAELETYWRERCAGAQAATLPTDRPRPAQSAFRGATCSRVLPGELIERVHATATGLRVTPFTVLLAAFQTLLYRYTGQRDLMVGCPVTTRRTRALRDLVGLLVNTIVLRATFSPDTTFAASVEEAGRQLVGSMARVGYPFALLSSARQSREPLYRIAITMVGQARQDTLPDGGNGPFELLAGHRSDRLDLPRLEGQSDLTVAVIQRPDSMAMDFRYDTDLFDRATIDRLIDLFLRVISTACANPAARVSAIPLIDDTERNRILAFGSA